MEDKYYLSLFYHGHGVSAAVISGSATDHWHATDDHDPDDEDEWLDEIDLEPAFAYAPALLDALREARIWIDEYCPLHRDVLPKLDAAIAKAEGRE